MTHVARALAMLLAFAVLLGSGARTASAVEIEFAVRPVKRHILALYDSRAEGRAHETRLHRFSEMPLNHLGFVLDYHDVNAPLQEPAKLAERYRGMITWFLEPLANPNAVANWLDAAANTGLRHVVLGDVAPPGPPEAQAAVTRIFRRLGLAPSADFVDSAIGAHVVSLDTTVMGFERPVDKVLPNFPLLIKRSDQTRVHLGIETRQGGPVSAVVATHPNGGFAAHDFAIFYEPSTDRVVWVLNPFAFFKSALGPDLQPVPDTTTLAGRRIYFSHIDGDGWNNQSEVERYKDAQTLSAEVVLKEAVEPYPDLPVTVGLIAGDAEPELGGTMQARRIARSFFLLPQVEVGSHTYSHPYDWHFFENYVRAAEMEKLEKFVRPELPWRERITAALLRLAGREPQITQNNKYIAPSDDLPRTYLKQPFDLTKEVAAALAVSESYAPRGKKAKAYLWSGDTTPFAAAIAATRAAGVRNINGGDSRLDREFPSVTYVPPISRVEGGERQIYSGNSNENTYTNDWTGPYYGFFLLEETLKNTDAPRRLKPFNLYYHMYSGEKDSALASIQYFLAMARRAEVIPIEASGYAAIADDFFGVEIVQTDPLAWTINRRGALQTIRFDDAEAMGPDMEASRGVLGATRHNGALYVALDPAVASVQLALKPRAASEASMEARPAGAALISSRWRIADLHEQPCGFTVTAQGYGAGDMIWHTKGRRAYNVSVMREGKQISQEVVWATADGLLKLQFETDAIEPLTLRFDCHE